MKGKDRMMSVDVVTHLNVRGDARAVGAAAPAIGRRARRGMRR
jgi:hypothetical protein